MATPDKDFGELRKEHKDLSDQLRRGAILSLTVLSLFVISFARACEKVNGGEARKLVCQIDKAHWISLEDRDVSYIFEQFDSSETTCDDPCSTLSLNPTPTPPPSQESAAVLSASTPPEPNAGSSAASPQPSPTPTDAQRKAASECQKKLEATLEQSAEKWFGVEAPIPGIHINLDLRYWVLLLPPLYFLSGIYLHILRVKLRAVKALGAHRLTTAKPEEVAELDRVYFDKQSSYGRFPGTLVGMLFVIIYLLFPIYLAYSFWAYSSGSLLIVAFWFAIFTLYSISYGHSVTNRLDEDIARLTNQAVAHNFIRKGSERFKNVLQEIARKLNPRIPLSTGSVLLFLTLALTISQNSCAEKAYRGYEVLMGTEGAEWYTSFGLFETTDLLGRVQGRVMYSGALLLALFVALSILLRSLYRRLTNARFLKFLLAWSGGVVVLTIIDFSAGNIIFPLWGGRNGLVIWLMFMTAWIRYGFSRQASKRQKWKWIRSRLAVFSVPFFVMAFMFTLQHLMLPGLLVYFIGVNLLFLGLIQMPYACEAVTPQPAQPQMIETAMAADGAILTQDTQTTPPL